MSIPNEPKAADRSQFLRRAALAPLCLCLVAGLHLARVWTCRQTPWKGGGFGMFSTVDDESARFLRCYLVTDDGDLPLELPPTTDKAASELRAAPTQARLDALARRLAEQSWRFRDQRQLREVSAIRERGGEAITATVLHGAASDDERSQLPADGPARAIEPIPRVEGAVDAIAFQAVRLECLRYRYDAAHRLLRVERIVSTTVPRTVGAALCGGPLAGDGSLLAEFGTPQRALLPATASRGPTAPAAEETP